MPHAKGPGGALHVFKIILIRIEISHLLCPDVTAFLIYPKGGHRILDNGPKQRLGQVHAMLIHQEMQPGYHPEGLGIAFKMIKVLQHLGLKHITYGLALKCKPAQVLFKPVLYAGFPKMSEGRVPDVMDQPCTLKDVTHSRLVLRQEGIVLNIHPYALGYILPQGLGQGGNLQGMGKPGPDKVAAVQGKDLGLVLEAAEGGASDNAVVILLKLSAQVGGG